MKRLHFTTLAFALGCAPSAVEADASSDAKEELAPVPAIDAACIPSTIAEAGPCCEQVYCYTPEAGACEIAGDFSPPTPCRCGAITGPYDGVTQGAQCCYLAWTQGCL